MCFICVVCVVYVCAVCVCSVVCVCVWGGGGVMGERHYVKNYGFGFGSCCQFLLLVVFVVVLVCFSVCFGGLFL